MISAHGEKNKKPSLATNFGEVGGTPNQRALLGGSKDRRLQRSASTRRPSCRNR